MTNRLPSTNIYTLSELEIDLNSQMIEFNHALQNLLYAPTLTTIRNSFFRAVVVTQPGSCYLKVAELKHLLRTGSSGADNYMWQHGIYGYTSPCGSYTLGEDLCIAGPDFCGLIDARIQLTTGKLQLYLRYVRAIYNTITSSSIISDIRNSFISNINNQRNQLKQQRISTYQITCCEFTGDHFANYSEVEFAHIESVATSPLTALNINNGVIIFKQIHAELTRRGIHDFAGMYDFCIKNNYSTIWAENYDL